MIALATIGDVEARIGALTPGQTARAPALIADASALVTSHTGQSFVPVVHEQVDLRPIRGYLWLPRRPVRDVTQVEIVGGPVLGGWCWEGDTRIRLPHRRDALDPLLLDPGCTSFRATYDHGWDAAPSEIVAVVCGIVARTLLSPSMVEGLVSERIGEYNYQLQQGAGAPGATVGLSSGDREILRRYRQQLSTIAMR